MNTQISDAPYKVAIARNPKDGQPKVATFTIQQLVHRVERAETSQTSYDAYHRQKAEYKRLSLEARVAKDAGEIDRAKNLKAQAKQYGEAIENTKFGPAILPFLFKDDVTFKTGNGWPQRDSDRITHFSLVMLNVESKTSKEELHEVLRDYEYILWPTITHRPDDPRYRIVLFPLQPLPIPDAQALIERIDARLPPRNDASKRLQNLDPSCLDKGRLMFLPRSLVNHPEPYAAVHNIGELLTSASFSVTPDIEASIDSRRKTADVHRKNQTIECIALRKTAPPDAVPLILTVNGEDRLHPDAIFETKDGYVRLANVTTKIGGVVCPFHADTKGSEFIAPNIHSGRPQLVCAKCGVFKMAYTQSSDTNGDTHEVNAAAFAPLVKKARSKRPTTVASVVAETITPRIEFQDGPTIHYFSVPLLPDIRNLIPSRGLFFVRSPKGTGKTQALASLVQSTRDENGSVLVLTHRRSLASNLSGRLNLANYQALEGGTLSKFSVICVNSLTSRLKENAANYDLVIIDESEQVLRNLLSSTLEYHLSDIFNKILLLIQNARRVVCLDADLSSELTIDIIARMRDPKQDKHTDEYRGIINTFNIGAGKTIRCLQNRHQLLAEISRAAYAGKKVFVACSTARAATIIGAMLRAQGKKVLVVTAATSEEPAVVAFQKAPNEILDPTRTNTTGEPASLEFSPYDPILDQHGRRASIDHGPKYDAVVASPSLQTGFSIDVRYFDQVYGWFQGVDGITFQDYDQALSRVRHCDDVTVWLQATEMPSRIDPPEIFIQHAKLREMKTRKRLPTETRAFSEGEQLWVRIEGMINYLTALWSHQRDAKFKAMKTELGFTIEDIDANEADIETGKLLWDTFKDVGPDYAALVFNAAELDDDEFLELQRNNHKTKEDHLALKRYRIAEAVNEELTQELVAQAIQENLLQTVARARSLVIDDDADRIQHDMRDRARQNTAFTKASHRNLEHELLVKHLCKCADIDIEAYYTRLTAGETIEVPVSQMDQLVDAFMERAQDFRHFFKLRIETLDKAVERAKRIAEVAGETWTSHAEGVATAEARRDRRMRIWKGTLGTVGLPITKKKRGPRNNQVACYFIEPAKVDLTMKAIVKTQRQKESLAESLRKLKKRPTIG